MAVLVISQERLWWLRKKKKGGGVSEELMKSTQNLNIFWMIEPNRTVDGLEMRQHGKGGVAEAQLPNEPQGQDSI